MALHDEIGLTSNPIVKTKLFHLIALAIRLFMQCSKALVVIAMPTSFILLSVTPDLRPATVKGH